MDKDAGTIAALMKRFREQRLPRAQRMLEKVEAGSILSDEDIAYLERIFKDANSVRPLVERNPEYHALVSRATDLYATIVEKAVENEKKAND
jgi:hypothetical protein